MAIAAVFQSVSTFSLDLALHPKLPASRPPSIGRYVDPCLLGQARSFEDLRPLQACNRFSTLSSWKHEGAVISNPDQCLLKGVSRRVAGVIAFAAESDQSQSSHEELHEGRVGLEQSYPKKPSPEIKPCGVVQAQLRALREQDFATVFEFASPKNKAHTGPLSRFTDMIQGRAYNVMLGHSSAKVLSTLSVGADRFQQRILIEGANGKEAIFSWSLSKQVTEPFEDCWMTDSVHRDE